MQRIVFEMEIHPDDETGKVKKYEVTYPYSEENLKIAQRYAYNGEYEIIYDGEPEPEPTEQEQLRADVDFLLAMGGVL